MQSTGYPLRKPQSGYGNGNVALIRLVLTQHPQTSGAALMWGVVSVTIKVLLCYLKQSTASRRRLQQRRLPYLGLGLLLELLAGRGAD